MTIIEVLSTYLSPSTVTHIHNYLKNYPDTASLVENIKNMQMYGDAVLEGKIVVHPTEKSKILRFCFRYSKLMQDYAWIQKYPGDDPVIKSFQYLLTNTADISTKLALIEEMLTDYSIDQDPEKWGGFLSLLNTIIILLGLAGRIDQLRERVREARDIYTYQKDNKLYAYIFGKLLSNACWWEQKRGDSAQVKKITAEISNLSKQLGNITLEADITTLLKQKEKFNYITSS